MSMYTEFLEAGCQIDHHESDLYVRIDRGSSAVLARLRADSLKHGLPQPQVSTFVSNHDGRLWYDIPFAYDPWWEARVGKEVK